MSLVIPADLPRFTGSPADLRHCATALGVAAWRLRQVADDLGAGPEPGGAGRERAASAAGAELHDASSEVRSALVEFADTAQALLVRLRYQRTLIARLYHDPPDVDAEESPSPGAREAERRSRSDAIREEVRRIVDEFRRAESTAAARIEAVSPVVPAQATGPRGPWERPTAPGAPAAPGQSTTVRPVGHRPPAAQARTEATGAV